MAVIPVELAGRSYKVHVGSGLLADLPAHCGKLLRKERVQIVTDSNVARHWREPVQASLVAGGLEPRWLVLDPGETAKSWQGLAHGRDGAHDGRRGLRRRRTRGVLCRERKTLREKIRPGLPEQTPGRI